MSWITKTQCRSIFVPTVRKGSAFNTAAKFWLFDRYASHDKLRICLKICKFRYTALDALRLVSTEDEYFHCESCNGELVAESDKLASQGSTDGDDNDRRRRREKLEDMLHRVEVCLISVLCFRVFYFFLSLEALF